jgi:hypothetical protein
MDMHLNELADLLQCSSEIQDHFKRLCLENWEKRITIPKGPET